jgi:hypothetical protein
MGIVVRQYAEEHVESVRHLNERLRAGGEPLLVPSSPVPVWLPKIPGRKIFQEMFVALDDDAARGGYTLKHQDFFIGNETVSIADFHSPVSEGAIDKRYPQIGVQLLRDALGRQPLLYGLGMGSLDESLPRMFRAAGWSIVPVPFYFRVVRPARFLRNINHLRRTPVRRCLFNMLAATGFGWLGIRAAQALLAGRVHNDSDISHEPVEEFSDWANDLWEQQKIRYGTTAVRDAETLNILYPKGKKQFIRLRIARKINGKTSVVGWAVLLDTELNGHKQFGDMRLGSIVDCFASPDDAESVVPAAQRCLESRGVDLIVSNQSHSAWGQAFRRSGFFQGPSNFLFASSPKLSTRLGEPGDRHINRGDGEGPINL